MGSVPVRDVTVVDTLPPVITLDIPADHGVPAAQQVSEWRQHPVGTTNVNRFGTPLNYKNPAGSSINLNHHVGNYGNPFIQDADKSKHGYSAFGAAGDHANYAGNFMAEETSTTTNGWVLGAVASAVTGLALLGYSAKKPTAVVTVPV